MAATFDESTLFEGQLVAASPYTSKPFTIENFKNVGIQLKAASITSGNCVFTFLGSIDGVNFLALNVMVTNVTNTNAQTLTRVASVTLSSNTTALVFIDPIFALKAIKVVATITTDGAYSAYAIAKA